MFSKHYVSVFCFFVAAALVSGCSGDNPRVLNPSAIAASASATGPVTIAGNTLALPSLTTGVAVTTTLGAAPAVTSGTTVTLTESTVSPIGLPTLQGLARRPESGTVSDTPLVYIEAVFSNAVTMNGQLGFTTPLPSGSNPNAGPYYVAVLPLGATPTWSLAIEGPGVVSGTTVSFTPPVAQTTFAASTPYYYVIYQAAGGSVPSPTPTPSPTPSPTPTPAPLAVSSAALSFTASGASYAQTFAVSELGYTGAFTETDTCNPGTAIATVSAASGPGPTANFTVTPQSAGSCAITVHDTNGQTSTVTVGVTITQGGVN